jgi:hypothetical protein
MMLNRAQQPLTLDMVRNYAPSAFAVQPHESRSERYTFIPTVDVIEGMQRAGFQPFQASQSGSRDQSRREYTKHMIRFRQMDRGPLAVGDSFFEVVLVNAHDGSAAYKLLAGLFRLVCGNGMVIPDGTVDSIHIRHSSNVIGEVIEGSQRIIGSAARVNNVLTSWRALELSAGEQQAFANGARVLRFGDAEGNVDTPITAQRLLQARRYDDNGNDLWHTFNRVQENVIKGGLTARPASTPENRRPRRVTTRHVTGIDQDVKLNKALWTLAEKMAELKASAATA